MSEPIEDRFQNLHEFVTQARISLDRNNWDYLIGGSDNSHIRPARRVVPPHVHSAFPHLNLPREPY
jgi:hypothetical protein